MGTKNQELVRTSVKVHPDVFNKFKEISLVYRFNLQKLVNRSMDLYLKDEEFRNKIHNNLQLIASGSL
jgi:hypothetical protein